MTRRAVGELSVLAPRHRTWSMPSLDWSGIRSCRLSESCAQKFDALQRRPDILKWAAHMCRNIKTLFNFSPPATDQEIRAASLQFVKKPSGFNSPSQVNRAAFDRAVDEVATSAHVLIAALVTTAEPRYREIEAERARARSVLRFGARPKSI
jgi:hypothetical protein